MIDFKNLILGMKNIISDEKQQFDKKEKSFDKSENSKFGWRKLEIANSWVIFENI